MINATIEYCVEWLQTGYHQLYGSEPNPWLGILTEATAVTLKAIAASNAAYHDVEHTVLVTLTGEALLRGKQQREGNVTVADWGHCLLALLCHDIGYVRGVCGGDRPSYRLYTTGVGEQMISLPPEATDASLTPYHVDRSLAFVAEQWGQSAEIDLARIQSGIDRTRFPIPQGSPYDHKTDYPALIRAADLLGQLADPRYLQKLPALFAEFAENGTNQQLGYSHAGDLRAGFPGFFWQVVYPYIEPSLPYLRATQAGQQVITNLYGNVFIVEHELHSKAVQRQDGRKPLPSSP